MTDQWYVARGEMKEGPFSAVQLQSLASVGSVQPSDMVILDGSQQWLAAREVPGLLAVTPAVSPPLAVLFSLPAGAVPPPSAIPITVPATVFPQLLETRICDLLRAKPCTIDEIAEKVAKPMTEVLGTLMRLELAKIIRRLPGSVFEMAGQTAQGMAKPAQENSKVVQARHKSLRDRQALTAISGAGATARPEDATTLLKPTAETPPVAGRSLTAGRPPVNQRFVDNGDNTVTDRKHRLMWIKNPGLLGKPIGEFRVPSEVDWVTANRACKELKFAGYSDWRLPTVPEWEKLCDEILNVFTAPQWGKLRDDILNVNPEQYLEECLNRWYWTSSESKHKPKEYYAAVNGFGEFQVTGPCGTTSEWYVRPVRTVRTVSGGI